MKTNEERLTDILNRLDSISYIKLDRIPEIDLYMIRSPVLWKSI